MFWELRYAPFSPFMIIDARYVAKKKSNGPDLKLKNNLFIKQIT